jgi:protein TonB
LHKAQPYYPVQAKFKGVQGIVRIAATIGKDGLVHDPKVVHNPDDELSEAALKAVSQWTYVPYLLNGQPVEVHTLMNVTFTLAR